MSKLKKYIFSIAIIIIACLCAGKMIANETQPSFKDRIDAIVLPFLANNNIPGAAIGIYYQGNEYIYTYGYADRENKKPVTSDTIFDLASITKVFTTTLLAVEMEEGKIHLDDPVVKYLSTLSTTEKLPIDNVKVINLATHTASLPRDINGLGITKTSKSQFMPALKQWQPTYPIGSAYVYSNVTFGLLGTVVEQASGQTYMSLLNNKVLLPLKMQHTLIDFTLASESLRAIGYNKKGKPTPKFISGFLAGGGALRSNISDMMAFLKANLGVGDVKAFPHLLAALRATQQPHFKVKDNFVMGLGWQLNTRNNDTYLIKNGGNVGFSTFIGFSPKQQFGVVVLTNRSNGRATQLGNKLLNTLSSSTVRTNHANTQTKP